MSEERAPIQQGRRVYRYSHTEELVIGETIWMRDRYVNPDAPSSYLLVNFVDTGIPAEKRAKPNLERKPSTSYQASIRRYIRDLERKDRLEE